MELNYLLIFLGIVIILVSGYSLYKGWELLIMSGVLFGLSCIYAGIYWYFKKNYSENKQYLYFSMSYFVISIIMILTFLKNITKDNYSIDALINTYDLKSRDQLLYDFHIKTDKKKCKYRGEKSGGDVSLKGDNCDSPQIKGIVSTLNPGYDPEEHDCDPLTRNCTYNIDTLLIDK
jgi:hypothetical protein